MEWNYCLTFVVFLGIFFFISGISALVWAVRNGHFQKFDEQARAIFTDEEPEGTHTDYFPGKISVNSKISNK